MPTNPIQVQAENFPWLDLNRYTFAMGVEKNGLVFVSGQTASAFDPEEKHVICKGDIVDQAEVAYQKIGVVLKAAGLGYENIVRTMDYVTPQGLPKYAKTAEVRRKYLGDTPVASTGVLVHALLRPDAFIEINAIAVAGKKEALVPDDPDFAHYKDLTYAPGVKVGDKIWLSGITGHEPDGSARRSFAGDTVAQAERAYERIGKVLEAGGASFGDVISTVDYVAPQASLTHSQTVDVRRERLGTARPAASSVIVHRLLPPGAHLEVEATAVVGGGREEAQVPGWEKSYEPLGSVPAAKKGGLVYLSGQASIDHTTGASVVAGYDIADQGRKAYQNLAEACKAAGLDITDIAYTVEYLPPSAIGDYRKVQQVRRELFGGHFPAAAGISMYQLSRPELLIQISAIALA